MLLKISGPWVAASPHKMHSVIVGLEASLKIAPPNMLAVFKRKTHRVKRGKTAPVVEFHTAPPLPWVAWFPEKEHSMKCGCAESVFTTAPPTVTAVLFKKRHRYSVGAEEELLPSPPPSRCAVFLENRQSVTVGDDM